MGNPPQLQFLTGRGLKRTFTSSTSMLLGVAAYNFVVATLGNYLFYGTFMSSAGLFDGGIKGQVTIGPLVPVERPGMINYRPYRSAITVLDQQGQIVMQFRSDTDGHFRISLKPGIYTLCPESTGRSYPRAAKQTVKVFAGDFTQVRILYDTGIR